MISTDRLSLVPASEEALAADLAGPEALGRVLGVVVPDSWPPDLYDRKAARWTLERVRASTPDARMFWGYYFVWRTAPDAPVLIGTGGFKGPPADGRVEVGYSVVARYQRRRFATEAVAGLLGFAFSHEQVEEVIAETLPELAPSIGVLERSGFLYVGAGWDAGVIRYSISRRAWEARAPAVKR